MKGCLCAGPGEWEWSASLPHDRVSGEREETPSMERDRLLCYPLGGAGPRELPHFPGNSPPRRKRGQCCFYRQWSAPPERRSHLTQWEGRRRGGSVRLLLSTDLCNVRTGRADGEMGRETWPHPYGRAAGSTSTPWEGHQMLKVPGRLLSPSTAQRAQHGNAGSLICQHVTVTAPVHSGTPKTSPRLTASYPPLDAVS